MIIPGVKKRWAKFEQNSLIDDSEIYEMRLPLKMCVTSRVGIMN